MNVFDGLSQGGVCCVDVLSLGIDEGGLCGEGSFKLIDSISKIIFGSRVGVLYFFQLVGLYRVGFLEVGNLFLKDGNLGCVLGSPGGIGVDEGGHFIYFGVQDIFK